MAAQKIPMMRDSMTATITENFVALGCPDPSSLETLTLRLKKKIMCHIKIEAKLSKIQNS